MEINVDEFNTGGLHKKHAVATWNLTVRIYRAKP
jgi:hypothetical protein